VGAAAALDFLHACREVTIILLMTRGGPPLRGGITERGFVGATTTIEIYLYELFTRSRDTGLVAAAALLVALCMVGLLGVYLAADRRLRRGTGGRRRRRSWGVRLPGARLGWASLSWLSAAFATATSVVLAFSLVRLSFSGLSAAFFDSILPRFPTADAYRTVIVDEGLWRALLNTLVLSVPVALLAPLIALPAAGALWAGNPPAGRLGRERGGSAVVLGAQLLGLTTGMHALVPLYLLFRRLGLIGSFLPVTVIYTAHSIPFALLALRASLRSLPPSLADAARAEGMGRWSYLVRVIAPLAVPTLVVIGAVGFLSTWNGFLVPLVFLSDDARFPVSVKLFSLLGSIGSANPRWNLFAAGSVVNLVVVGALTLAVRRPMREGPLAEAGD
jgi:ABC-type glycerol-3-phosphate transport system permease component